MAWESGNADVYKRNIKFESFLKRTLSDEAFERVRAHEACVVVSESENKSFKYAVINDEKLYLTENPPKTLQEVLHFKDIFSVELVNEFPNFLSGEERRNTQHIAITYWTSEPKRRSFRRSKRSPRGSLTELNETRSNASTPVSYTSSMDGSFMEDSGYQTQNTGSFSHSSSRSSGVQSGVQPGMQSKRKKNPGGNDLLDHSILKSLKEEIEEDVLEDNKKKMSEINSAAWTNKKKLPEINSAVQTNKNYNSMNLEAKFGSINVHKSQGMWMKDKDKPEISTKVIGNGFSEKLPLLSSSHQFQRALPPVKIINASFSENEIKNYMETSEGNKVDVVDIKGCCLYFRKYQGYKNQVAPTVKNDAHKLQPHDHPQDMTSLPTDSSKCHTGSQASKVNEGTISSFQHPSKTSSLRGSRSGTPLVQAESNISELNTSYSDLGRSTSSFTGLSTLSVDGVTEKRKTVINIYLLNLSSNFLVLTRSAWNNYIIRSTLALEPEQVVIPVDPPHILSKKTRDKCECKYSQLKQDLFRKKLSLGEKHALIAQLCSATKSDVLLKKLFWRSGDLLSFLVHELHKYLPNSSTSLHSNQGKAQRIVEIEYSVLILSVISLMLRETEILPSRLQILKLEGGKLVRDLFKILVCQPDFTHQSSTLKHWSASAIRGRKSESGRNVNDELARLRGEYIHRSISLAFELMLVARQVPTEESTFLTISGIVSHIQQLKAMEQYLDCLMSQVMELVNLSQFDILSPVQALLVFQTFYLLLTILEQNGMVVSYTRNKFYEEFRYFIQSAAVSRRLPDHYPIKILTISLIDQVVIKILGTLPLHLSQDF